MSGRHPTRLIAILLFCAALLQAAPGHAVQVNLATVTCEKYENEVLVSTTPGVAVDPIDTVMWLFGFSIARAGEHVMYGDSLSAFGFALDTACKNNPGTPLLAAVTAVKSKHDNPMDLSRLDCTTFEKRHADLRKSDAESANTLTMWLFGYSVGLTADHVLDTEALPAFDAALDERCKTYPQDSVFDALRATKPGARKR